jgi:hypothetical protein
MSWNVAVLQARTSVGHSVHVGAEWVQDTRLVCSDPDDAGCSIF